MKALSGLRNKYKRLKRQYKKKTHAQGESSSEVRIQELETKLELKELEIIHLQNKKLMLEEKIKELESEQKETKLDKKNVFRRYDGVRCCSRPGSHKQCP